MWFKLLLCLLVAFAYADHNPGWKHNHQYVYLVRGRTLASLNQVSDHYSGIILKAKLTIRPRSDGHLGAKISNAQYANFHGRLENRWEEEIPDSQLSYQELPLSSGPFKIVMSNNVAKNLVADQTMPNWQVNMIKGIVSQLQLDVDAENRIRSSINQFTQEANNAVFKTMEKTVTGESETLYEIHPLPEQTLQSEPWLAPLKELKENGDFIEVVKNKNYTHSRKTPSYHFGFQGIGDFDINNKIGEFFSRTSMSRAVLSGNLDDFTIQSSVTFDQVTMNPTLQDKQRGSTNSIVNITLSQMEQQDQEFEEVSNSMSVGLIYSYNHPFADSNEPSERKLSSGSGESSSSESNESNSGKSRQKRDLHLSSSETGATAEREQFPVQEKPHIDEAPASPLLPLTVGYDGQAISKKQNIMENVRTLAKEIGQEFQQPEEIPKRNTVGKFLMLSSLVRVMNQNEIKQVAAQLYNKDPHSALGAAWFAFRDAVAQAGTGPAVLNIEDWIRKGKIFAEEAAAVVATAAESARQPTEKYMKVFFGMIEDEQIMQQQYLNQSLLLSYTKLVHQVYVSKDQSHGKLPVYSFGSFNTEQGRMFVKKEVIPFLSQHLEEAVTEADTERIHVYIRALGNVGHPQILQTFKPYLEGTKKMSQFQRVLIVTALDNLANSHPTHARSVLYKIYQNLRDAEQVRVAAVYLLMRTDPSPSMLQRMAAYTNIDTNNHVNAAVKSVIEALADHQLPQFAQLRKAAKLAKALLNPQDFGVQHSQSYLRTYVMNEMESEVQQIVETHGGEDSVVPKGMNALFVGRFGGVKQQLLKLQALVSSVEDLINVFEQQTKPYRRLLREKQAHKSVDTKWSSENTAKLLNMQNEQREQLEGYLLLQVDALKKIWSFDNQTIENYTAVVQELEQELRNGKHFDFNKMAIYPEMALSFPTAWGLPLIYSYDRPTLVHVESDIKVVAEPPVAANDGLQKPEKIDIQYQINGYISGRIQSQLGFFAPFNHKRYSAGYDKNLQLRIPKIAGKVQVDVNNKQASLESERSGKQNVNLLHFSTWPYTSQREIYDLQSQNEIIRSENPYRVNTHFGEKSSGIAFSLQVTSDKPIDYGFMYEVLSDKNPASARFSSWLDENIEHVQIDLGINSDRSTTNKMIIHLGHQQKYTSGSPDSGVSAPHKYPVNQESWERQKEFLKNSSKGIKDSNANVVDTVVLFEGQRLIKYSATIAGGKSNIDPKSRILMQAEKDNQQDQPWKVSFSSEGKIPNTNSLDLNHALDSDFTTSVEAQAKIGNQNGNPSQFDIKVKLSKSEERKQYLKDQPQYKECQKQMQEGNNQLPPCAILTAQANLLDEFSVQVDYQNVDPAVVNVTYKAYSMLRHYLYSQVSENVMVEDQSKQNSLSIVGQFNPALSHVNVSIATPHINAEIKNVKINPLARTLLVHHPLYHAKTRAFGQALSYDTYRPICVVDKTAANTFDNKTYPINLDKDWVVLLHYVPRRPSSIKNKPELSVSDQLNQQIEGYIIYGRASGNDNSQKEIKIVIQAPSTLGKVIDVTLKPTDSSSYPRLFIQNEKIIYDGEGSHIYDGYMQVYKLPNNELKAEVYDSFSVVYDGVRAKISILNDKFRDAARGLCGTFTGEPETDFTHPGNCIIHDAEVFVATNAVPEKQRTKRMNDMMMIQAEEKKCYQKTVRYAKVVSAEDSGLTGDIRTLSRSNNMRLQTKYIASSDQTCFTISAVPACKRGYREKSITKSVKVHCLKSSSVTELWKRQIDQGHSPSFANKRHNKHMMVAIAQSCEQ